jgi:hypothetical protein
MNLHTPDWRIGLQAAGVRRGVVEQLAAYGNVQVASDLLNIRDWQAVPGVGARTADLIVEFLLAQ